MLVYYDKRCVRFAGALVGSSDLRFDDSAYHIDHSSKCKLFREERFAESDPMITGHLK